MFGQVVSELRLRQGLTQEDLAGRPGLSVRGIRTLESGRVRRPRPATVRLLADAFRLAGAARDEFVRAAVAGSEARPAKDVAGDPALAVPAGPAAARAGAPPVPRQLPAALADFTGRAAELRALTAILDQAGAGALGTVVISAIGGTAGVGKTITGAEYRTVTRT